MTNLQNLAELSKKYQKNGVDNYLIYTRYVSQISWLSLGAFFFAF